MIREKRWQLIPTWLKIVVIFYLFLGVLLFFSIILTLLGFEIPIALYGFSSSSQFSIMGTILLFLFALKVSVGILFAVGNEHAITLAIIDTFVGIALCILSGFILPLIQQSNSVELTFQFELLILFPMLFLLIRLGKIWNGPYTNSN